MPVLNENLAPDVTEALENMEKLVQGFKRDLLYSAPELRDELFGLLQMRLSYVILDIGKFRCPQCGKYKCDRCGYVDERALNEL